MNLTQPNLSPQETKHLVLRTRACAAPLTAVSLVLLLLTSCLNDPPLKGGRSVTAIQTGSHTNSVALTQSDNPKQSSSQTVQSQQTVEYVLPAGSVVPLAPSAAGPTACATNQAPVAVIPAPTPVRVLTFDKTQTTIGAAQKDTVRDWARRAANLQPVMWAGIAMMTIVAGAFAYFGWWTKAAMAIAVGIAMVVLAQTLPDHGAMILAAGLTLFALLALLVLYAYHKGKLDQNGNGIPDFLEPQSARKA